MTSRTYAYSFVQALKRRGVEHVFANSGTDHAPIVEALTEMRNTGEAAPAFHVVPHENLAMAMAQGYYRASGKPAVVLVHVTVGTANTICSLMNARRANVPVLLIAGRNPLSQDGHVGSRSVPIHWGQDAFDQGSLVREYTKWEHEFRAYQDVDALIDRALVIAMSEPRGPVYLSLPRELLADTDKTTHTPPTAAIASAQPGAAAIDELAGLLAAAERPAIVTSTTGVDREARRRLEDLSRAFAIPVLQSWPYAINLRSDHPMNLRMHGLDWLARADVILTIDAAVPWVPRRFKPRHDAKVLHLAADPTYSMYPYRDFPASRLIAGSSRDGLSMLHDALRGHGIDEARLAGRRTEIARLVEAAAERRRSRIEDARTRSPIHASWTARCVNEVKGENACIVNELGVPFDCLEFGDNDLYVGETTAGGLGSGVGFGLGAKLADPSRNVICCVGDGSFMFGNPTPAFVVADALRLPILIVVASNGMWYAVEQSTVDIYPEGAAAAGENLPLTQFGSTPDYAGIATACGAWGETVSDPNQLEAAMRRGLARNAEGQAALINVITAPGTR
ncbi:MAG: thiamine pyrophosphate-requiring protein [Gammaproteobacteria bacterium]|nr:thiamine pyrophosphate-requiring protein [Gammaproteobacteria bacterium]MDH4253322.1 thiamine pyrophosphate-requiring protein [Gammaproteobacteria bacterium]MDH5309931.1 thiamine pyrophosphate-requiring protein [Gammaproteobacteria bacterium]